MKYKLLATDLDGTLLNSKSEISQGNRAAIKKAIDKGLHVIICSGRSQESIALFNEQLGINKRGCYGIGFNGGVVYKADTMEILYEKRMKKEYAKKVVRAIKKVSPEAPVMVYADGKLIYYDVDDENIIRYTGRVKIKKIKMEDLENSIDRDVLKMIIRWHPEKLKEISDGVRDEISKYCSEVFSDVNLLEFSALGSNKSSGISHLASLLGIDMTEIITIGDNYNDYEMIKDAGFGVAVKNAVDEIKEVADYVTKNDNDNEAVKEVIDMVLD